MPSKVVGRLAPSPTGALHLGNARSFLLAWLSVRQQGGILRLRIEDIDSPRVKPWAVDQAIEDLQWLGLDWDSASDSKEESVPFRQTTHMSRYVKYVQTLQDEGVIYPCRCSRKDVALAASAPHGVSPSSDDRNVNPWLPLEGDVYPGTCFGKSPSWSDLPSKYCLRWRFADSEMRWEDGVQGLQSANPSKQLGDFVVAKYESQQLKPAYQLAVVLDDQEQCVTEVVRGDDLIYSTYRQVALWRHFGWETPKYYHVPLIVGPDGRRLAKRHGDTRLSEFRRLGIQSEAILGYLAKTLGFIEELQPVSSQQLIGRLDWGAIPRMQTVFNLDKELPNLRRLSGLH